MSGYIPGDSSVVVLLLFSLLPTHLFVPLLAKPLIYFASPTLEACGSRLCLCKGI